MRRLRGGVVLRGWVMQQLKRMLKELRREVASLGPWMPGALSLKAAALDLGTSERRLALLIQRESILLCELGNQRGIPRAELKRLRIALRKSR